MAYGIMAAGALQTFGFAVDHIAVDLRRNVFVTAATGVFRHLVIEFRYLDRVGVVAAGEIKRLQEAVVGFDGIFSDEVMRRVTVVTRRHRMMAGFLPCIVLRPHDMTVGASLGIIGEVGISLGVDKGIGSQADNQADENR